MRMNNGDKFRLKSLEKRIANGDLEAMMEYAQMFHSEFPEDVTDEIAAKMVEYYEICLEAGNLTAALNLGAMYYTGEFITRNFAKAMHYYELATEADDGYTQIRAWCNLGYCYYYGRDIPVDDEKAFNCYMHAAIQHDANALYKIGDMYRHGRYVAKDEKMAVLCYNQAAASLSDSDDSHADIFMRLGKCALYGIGMEKDYYMAMRMLSVAEMSAYTKIKNCDPFASSILSKIKPMLDEAKRLLEEELNL